MHVLSNYMSLTVPLWAAPSQQRVVVSRWEMPSLRPRAKPLKWRNNQWSGYVRIPSRWRLVSLGWLCLCIDFGRDFKDWGWVWHLRSEDNFWIYCVLAMSNVLCQVVPSIMYIATGGPKCNLQLWRCDFWETWGCPNPGEVFLFWLNWASAQLAANRLQPKSAASSRAAAA